MEFQCMFFFLQSRHELEILLAKWELVQFIYWKGMKSMLKMESIIIIAIVMLGVRQSLTHYTDKRGLKVVTILLPQPLECRRYRHTQSSKIIPYI